MTRQKNIIDLIIIEKCKNIDWYNLNDFSEGALVNWEKENRENYSLFF